MISMSKEMTHADWLEAMIGINEGAIAIVDPDVRFWESVEDWDFGDALLAGRSIPAYVDETQHDLNTRPRIHPSFWWIPDAGKLWSEIAAIRSALSWSGGDLWSLVQQYVDGRTVAHVQQERRPSGCGRAGWSRLTAGCDAGSCAGCGGSDVDLEPASSR